MSKRLPHPPMPAGDMCSARAAVAWTDLNGNDRSGFACWYPQMGGYAGKCVVEPGVDADAHGVPYGFDAWVWHDGEFAFDESASASGRGPIRLHHCGADQFVEFGKFVEAKIADLQRSTLGETDAASAPPIDHRILLAKLLRSLDAIVTKPTKPDTFTDSEWAELQRLAGEAGR